MYSICVCELYKDKIDDMTDQGLAVSVAVTSISNVQCNKPVNI